MFRKKNQKEHAKVICLKSQNNGFQWQLFVEPNFFFVTLNITPQKQRLSILE